MKYLLIISVGDYYDRDVKRFECKDVTEVDKKIQEYQNYEGFEVIGCYEYSRKIEIKPVEKVVKWSINA